MVHRLTEVARLAGLVALLVELLLARAQQLLRAAARAAAATGARLAASGEVGFYQCSVEIAVFGLLSFF